MRLKKTSTIWLLTCSCFSLTPLFTTTSCSDIDTSVKNADGTDWQGVYYGCFFNLEDFYPNDIDGTITYTSSSNFQGENIVLPNYVRYEKKIYKVLLGEGCFAENYGISGSFELNDFIDEIPNRCFYFSSVEKIIMHHYPKQIGEIAFADSFLSEFVIKQQDVEDTNWTINIQSIGKQAFQSLPSLTGTLIFGEQFKSMGENAFEGCSRLDGVDFRFCTNFRKIPDAAFNSCSFLHYLVLPPRLLSIGDDAFKECGLLEEVELTNDDMEFSLGDATFYGCKSLHNFSRNFILTDIGSECFCGDTSLSTDFAPWETHRLKTISASAFSQTNYTTVTFHPGYPQEVFDGAFNSCSLLSTIDFSQYDTPNPPTWTGKNIFEFVSEKGTILLPKNADVDEWMTMFAYWDKQEKRIVWTQGIQIDNDHWTFSTPQ